MMCLSNVKNSKFTKVLEFLISWEMAKRNPDGVVANVLYCDIIESEFELYPRRN